MMRHLAAVTALFLVTPYAAAELISSNGYTLDAETNIITGGGLQWYRWSDTVGTSLDDLDTNAQFKGWSVATSEQAVALFSDFGWGGSIDDVEVITSGTYSAGTDDDVFDQFIGLFGATTDIGGGVDDIKSSSAIFGSPRADLIGGVGPFAGTPIDRYRTVSVSSDYTLGFGGSNKLNPTARMSATSLPGNSRGDTGIVLVRSVPTPAPVAFMLFGVAGLVMRRRVRRIRWARRISTS